MTIYFCSHNLTLIRILADELSKQNHTCITFNDYDSLIENLDKGYKRPHKSKFEELIVLDYTLWNHQYFDFFEPLTRNNIFIPFIYFNDPCFIFSNRISTWKHMIKLLFIKFPHVIPFADEANFINAYKEVFSQLAKLVESDVLSPYIPLMQKAKSLPEDLPFKNAYDFLLNKSSENNENVLKFVDKVKLPDNLQFLLDIFFKNLGNSLSATALSDIYKEKHKNLTEQSAKTLISKLRKCLKEDEDFPYSIITTDKGYMLIQN